MSGAKEYLQVKFLKTLEPLGSMSVDKLEEIANKSKVEELPPGRVVFRQGEKDNRSTYLLSGQLELQITGNPRTETVKAKTVEARYPIAQEWPRPCTCRTKTNAILLHIDSDLLEILLNDDPSGTYEVTEIGVEEDPESDWMLRFLQSPAFLQLPTENIQTILMRLEEKEFKAGQTVIHQGDSDQWYYIVKKGKCAVSRRPAPKAEEVRLALLGPGDGFGEEALITEGKRNATVTMKEDGILMRLGKSDFHELLVKPMVRTIDHNSMMDKVKAGAALIDVRTNKEFSENGIKGAQNIPLSMLRIKAKDLNTTREHIVYCNDSMQSSAAAFLLAQSNLNVYVLLGGLDNQTKPFIPAASTTASTPAVAPVVTPAIPTLTTPVSTPAVVAKRETTVQAKASEAVDEKQYQDHKRQAQVTAERANQFAKVHEQAEARTDHLREKADALRAQADRLAMKTANTEAARKKAEAEIEQIKHETLKQRDQLLASAKEELEKEREEELARIRAEAERVRRESEEELRRIQDEANSVNQKQKQLEDELKRAENEKLQSARAAEVARLLAKQEADKVKAEAELIRQQAIKDAETLRKQMESRKVQMQAEEAARQQQALVEAKRKSELAVAEAAKAAEEARRQAALEADAIRKQALKEAESLRLQLEREKQQAAEQSARLKAEEQLRRQEIEQERQRALDDARKLAHQEAEQIRTRALQELQLKAREDARLQAEADAQRQKTIEEVKRKAMETARLEAQQAAEAIRREALEEANHLRAEMEKTRQLVEEEARRARAKFDADEARLRAEEEEHTREAEAAARWAAEEAERRRHESQRQLAEAKRREQQRLAELEAQRIAAEEAAQREAALAELRLAEEQARHDAFEEIRLAEEQARLEAEEQQRKALEQQAIQAAEERQRKAKQMAESIKHKLAQQGEQQDQFSIDVASGPKLAKARVHVVKDKTILEGDEDIFIFKAPSERPPSREEAEELLRQAEANLVEKSRKELPSFEIDYADHTPAAEVVNKDSEFSDSILLELDNITANSNPAPRRETFNDNFVVEKPRSTSKTESKKKSRRRTSLIALAASIVVMVTISVVAITRQTYVDVEQIATADKKVETPQRGLAAIRSEVNADNRAIVEDKVKTEAELEFRQLLNEWRKEQGKPAE